MEWLIWVLIGYGLFRLLLGRGCHRGRLHGRHERGALRGLDDGPARMTPGERASFGSRAVARRPPGLPRESLMESLQRRFVEGGITVEQYEAELDRLYARPGNRSGGAGLVH